MFHHLLLGLLSAIIISNLVKNPTIGKRYGYKTINKEFTYQCMPSKGLEETDMLSAFESFKKENPEYKELILYRTYEKQWWKFWKWREYLFVKRWQYPYLH